VNPKCIDNAKKYGAYDMKIIILAGGSGARLWPLSRSKYPKQFLKLKGMVKSIFQLTVGRCLKLAEINDIYILTNEDYRIIISAQIEEIGRKLPPENIICEPQTKNTLPAIYNGIQEIRKQGEEIVAVFSSDHLIKDEDDFIAYIKSGQTLAKDYLITFGVCPTSPETGYGYIKPGQAMKNGFLVEHFKEKPDFETAGRYLREGYLWNSGMFMFRTDVFTQEVKKCAPLVYQAFLAQSKEECFANTPSVSIDNGVMEHSDKVAVIPLKVDWDDLGSFATFYGEYNSVQDANGNVCFNSEVMLEARNNMVYSDGSKAIVVIGVDNLVVVDQKDAILICHRDQTQKVKDAVTILKGQKDNRADFYFTSYRPWGCFAGWEDNHSAKIKNLCILAGKSLCAQNDHHTNLHIIVNSGNALVETDGTVRRIGIGQSIQIPSGQKYQLTNASPTQELNVVAVQIDTGLPCIKQA